jgi:hypothetical protein
VDDLSLEVFWAKHIEERQADPTDFDDMMQMPPWWRTYRDGQAPTLLPLIQPTINGVDPEESTEERTRREADQGSMHHAENRKRYEKAKQDKQRDRKIKAAEKVERLRQTSDKMETPDVSWSHSPPRS